MGLVPYGPMHTLQEQRHREVAAGEADDTLFLLEHHRVVTLGRNTGQKAGQGGAPQGGTRTDPPRAEHLLVSEEHLRQRGVELFATGRGGDVTYHGPGQIVGYPILQLQEEEGERDIKRYVGLLEEILIRTAADFGVAATRVEGLRGIWVGNDKLAAIGVRISKWTTMHGFALNVSTHLEDFGLIVPCGLHGRGVTSLEKLLGQAPSLREVEDRLVAHGELILNRAAQEAPPTPLPNLASGHQERRVAAV